MLKILTGMGEIVKKFVVHCPLSFLVETLKSSNAIYKERFRENFTEEDLRTSYGRIVEPQSEEWIDDSPDVKKFISRTRFSSGFIDLTITFKRLESDLTEVTYKLSFEYAIRLCLISEVIGFAKQLASIEAAYNLSKTMI